MWPLRFGRSGPSTILIGLFGAGPWESLGIEILRWRRSAARSRVVLDVQALDQLVAAAERAADANQNLAILAECLDKVQGDAREVLNLKYTAAISCRQIADRLGKGVGAIEMILTRTRRALRDCIERKLAKA